jgi:hypothetical protein
MHHRVDGAARLVVTQIEALPVAYRLATVASSRQLAEFGGKLSCLSDLFLELVSLHSQHEVIFE